MDGKEFIKDGELGIIRMSKCHVSSVSAVPCDICYHAGWEKVTDHFSVTRTAAEAASYYFVFTVDGSAEVKLDGIRDYTAKNRITIMAPGKSQHYYVEKNGSWTHYFMHIDGENCRKFFSFMIDKRGYSFDITEKTADFLTEKFEEIIQREYVYFDFEVFIAKTIYDILIALIEDLHESNMTDFSKKSRMVSDVISYIYANYNDRALTLKEISNRLYVSEEHLIRVFKREMNMTPYKFLKSIRLNMACNLLIYGSKTIKEVAYEVGYSSVGGFNAQFKQVYGMTPVEYRKSYRIT